MYDKELKEKIRKQEIKDRYIGTKVLEQVFSGRNITCTALPVWANTDIACSATGKNGNTVNFQVEVKERNKSDWQLEKYPQAELKVDKLKKMKQYAGDNAKLVYMVLLNDKEALLFYLNKIDFSKIDKTVWHIKKTQYDNYSEYEEAPIYLIPYSMAFKKIDITEFVN